ncbi:high-osmolarity-induced transcription 1 [Fusarium heterosporum]|uniref:High-osmolarity-induced transcription 1 n=1 Tax=Fusarium heterosporum TaxID=42747 RepID=A0A8H5TTZ5_FUSHE|nr:high-osmolarity-induced transcription 1 [Fusarium heterosporum]
MLLSPNQSPAPSVVGRSVSEGPPRKPTSGQRLTPARSGLPPKQTDPEKQISVSREQFIDDAVEQVPMDLARVVVNMQDYYATELEAERQRTENLASQNQEMMARMEILEKRLQMHVVLMDGFVNFMREVKERSFTLADSAELEIAKAFGGEHLQEVESLVPNYAYIQSSVEQPTLSADITSDFVVNAHNNTPPMREDWSCESDPFGELPPTPDMDSTPVRSTGLRAPKRRNPPTKPHRPIKRRSRANILSVKLRNTASCKPINAESDGDSNAENVEANADSDYTPDLEQDEEPELQNVPATPSSSLSDDDFDFDSAKPRYSVPRSVGYRHAAGPPGCRFKYHRMPKTVALVWQEWKYGSHGNPAIEELEKKYNTTWRMGTLQERKYASNYVGVRQKIVRKVEEMCEEDGMTVKQACEMLDERVDGRMQLLMAALRKGEDPLAVIPRRR